MLLTPKYKAASGAYKTSIIRALIAVFISPCAMSPFARNIHHITMAVQGDNPRSMTPAIYCGFPAKMTFAYNVIITGATAQLAINVTSKGLGLFAASLMSLNLIPTTVGYIMKKRRMPIGIDNCPNLREFMN
jgi:hypothetical protein